MPPRDWTFRIQDIPVHAYWTLRPAVIWDTSQNDLPPLVDPLRRLVSGIAS
jgi:uncharacterized protein with HEPN domain